MQLRLLLLSVLVGSVVACSTQPQAIVNQPYVGAAASGTTATTTSGAGVSGSLGLAGAAGAPRAGAAVAGSSVVSTAGVSGAATAGVSGAGFAGTAVAGLGGAAGLASAGVAGALTAGTAAVGGSGGASGASAGAGGASTASACTTAPLGPGDHMYSIDSKNGLTYQYILSVPKSVDESKPNPLLVHWHALSSDPEEARRVTSVDAKAEAAQWIVVYPISPDKSWDVGSCCTATVGGKSRDEEVFARELVKDVTSKACVDPHRIYTNGFSNGGMISQFLACKMTDVFAASAPMGSTLTISKSDCKPSRPISMFLINGTEDPLVGYDVPSFAGGISVPDDVQFWVDQNQCTGTPEMFLMMGKVTCKRWTQCAAGTEVAACAAEGMGHCVPGMVKESASNCLTKSGIALGAPNDDIDAIQMDFDFLKRFSLP